MEIILKQCDCSGISVIVDAIIPIMVAVITVYAAEYFARKRDYKQKRIEVQIDYLKQCIEYLAELEVAVLELSRCIENILNKDLSKRHEMVNTVTDKHSKFNEKMIANIEKLKCVEKAVNIDIDSYNLENNLKDFSDNMRKIYEKYVKEGNTEGALDGNNQQAQHLIKELNATMQLIAKKLSKLLSGKKLK